MYDLGRERLSANQHIVEGEYWLKKLSDDFERSVFPYDYEKKDNYNIGMRTWNFEFSGSIYSKVMKISNKSEIRLFMILVSGINILLSKYCGSKDIIIGLPIVKQDQNAEFINTVLTLRNEITKEESFKEILLKVRDSIREASENQNYPFETLIYKLGFKMESENCPLFDTFVVLDNIHIRRYIENVKTNFNFFFNDTGNGLECEIQYNPEMYDEATVSKIACHLENLLSKSLENINMPIKDIAIIDDNEKKCILNEFNKSMQINYKIKRLNYLFEEQVDKTPNKIAVQYEHKYLTYCELNEKSNALARKLMDEGVGKDQSKNIVGISLEKSIEMIVSMIAVLKAGAAYLPIDIEYPQSRKQFMINDSNIEVLIVKGSLDEQIQYNRLVINVNDEQWYDKNVSNIEKDNYTNNLAYIIYTSGSVGNPKGVIIEHSSIINTVLWRKNYYKFNEKDNILQIPSFSFDSSVEDIFTTLISGSKLILVNQQDRYNVSYISELIELNSITNMLITPALYKVILQEYPKALKNLRVITIAGESFDFSLVQEHFNYFKNVRLINEYGPTENCVCTTAYEFTNTSTKVLIGKPINNVKCYILDSWGDLSPIGFKGELCVAGVGLAKGYLNRPELSIEKFIINPINPDEIIYKTGDIVRWLSDGNIEFLGRSDYQVKIRGNRIELGEIEKQLLTNKNITDTIVVDKVDSEGNKILVQYFVSDKKISRSEIKDILREALPEYMIPLYFVQLDKMPLTQNGKIDRRALPENFKEAFLKTEYEEPTNKIEFELLNIWKKILNIDKIGINDNFFEIGGHSLRATTLVSKIRKSLNVDIPLREVFTNPTIRSLSKYINGKERYIGATRCNMKSIA